MVVLGEWLVRLWCPRICCGHCGAGVRGVVGVCGDVFTVVMSMSEGNGAAAAQEPVVMSRSEEWCHLQCTSIITITNICPWYMD